MKTTFNIYRYRLRFWRLRKRGEFLDWCDLELRRQQIRLIQLRTRWLEAVLAWWMLRNAAVMIGSVVVTAGRLAMARAELWCARLAYDVKAWLEGY